MACVLAWVAFGLLAVSPLHAAEPPKLKWKETGTLAAPEAHQAAAADGKLVYAISSTQVAKYDRASGQRLAVSTGEAKHLNSGFFWEGKLYCAHSNYPKKPEVSEIKRLDPASMELATWKDFGNFGGSLTWAIRDGDHWWCNFAHYGADNAKTFLAKFDGEWREVSRWTYPKELIAKLGTNSLSGGLWRGGDLLVTGHDDPVLFRLRLPAKGEVLELVGVEGIPIEGQGIAHDPATGGLVGIRRSKQQVVFAAPPEAGSPKKADGARAEPQTWKAGVARAVITPEKGVWLAGYGTKRAPDGKLHDLWMKALALEAPNGHRVVLITSDFQGVPKGMSDRVFARLAKEHRLARADVLFTFSHNHCGPRLGDDLVDYYPIEEEQVQLVAEYTDQMVTKTVTLVGEALKDLAPATLAQGEGKTTFAVNRRNNREAEVAELIAQGKPLAGPVDHAVPVLTVTRPDGKLAAILFGYACHPTTLNITKWCGDYPGFAQIEIEKNHSGATAMFVNTCGGDQNPLPRRSVELCEKYGHMLAEAVEETLKQPLRPISPGLKTAFEMIDLPYLEVVSREQLLAAQQDANAVRARWGARMLKRLEAGDKFEAAYPYPVHAWRLGGEMLVVGMGAETVVDYALRFKRDFGPGTWVLGYSDDMISYIPSRRVWEEGGYEGGTFLFEYGRPAFRWSGDIEDRIARSVEKLVGQVK